MADRMVVQRKRLMRLGENAAEHSWRTSNVLLLRLRGPHLCRVIGCLCGDFLGSTGLMSLNALITSGVKETLSKAKSRSSEHRFTAPGTVSQGTLPN